LSAVLLEGDLLQVGLLHRLDARLGEGLAVHVGDQMAGHFLPDVVREVQLDHAPRDLALAEPGKLRLALHAVEGLLPGFRHDLGGFLDLQAPLAAPQLCDVHLHGRSTFMATPRVMVRDGGVEHPRVAPHPTLSAGFVKKTTTCLAVSQVRRGAEREGRGPHRIPRRERLAAER